MSDKDSGKKTSWKRAFHLLKCVAIRKFRVKFHENLSQFDTTDSLNKTEFKEKMLYPRAYRSADDEAKLDNLARQCITGIVEEIKSRSQSSSSSTPPKTPEPVKIDKKYNTPLIKTDSLKIKRPPNSKIKIVESRKIDKNVKPKPVKQKIELKDDEWNPLRSHRPSLQSIKENSIIDKSDVPTLSTFLSDEKKNDGSNYGSDQTRAEKPDLKDDEDSLGNEEFIPMKGEDDDVFNQVKDTRRTPETQKIELNETLDPSPRSKEGLKKSDLSEEDLNNPYKESNPVKIDPDDRNVEEAEKIEFKETLEPSPRSKEGLEKEVDSASISVKAEGDGALNEVERTRTTPETQKIGLNETLESSPRFKQGSEKKVDDEVLKKSDLSEEDLNNPYKESNPMKIDPDDRNPGEAEKIEFKETLEPKSKVDDQGLKKRDPSEEIKSERDPKMAEKELVKTREVEISVKTPKRDPKDIAKSKDNDEPDHQKTSPKPRTTRGDQKQGLENRESSPVVNKIEEDTRETPKIEIKDLPMISPEPIVIKKDHPIGREEEGLELETSEVKKDQMSENEDVDSEGFLERPKQKSSNRRLSPTLFSYKQKKSHDSSLSQDESSDEENLDIIKMSEETKPDDVPSEDKNEPIDETTANEQEQPVDETQEVTEEPSHEDVQIKQDQKEDNKKKQEEKPKKPKRVEIPKMDPEFYYDYESMIFKPVISEESNLNENMLQLFHSFGYDCKKRSNLHLIDEETLIFSAGNLVQLLNIRTKEQRYLKTLSGGAVGAISVHPSRKYFSVGEKGNMPNINIFEYPSLKLYRILRQGTVKGYAYLDFDPPGNLLASLGSSPDFMLTIWDWREEKIVLRTKAFSQDVFKVTFSKDLEGILTSGGTGHIKFWKMASTFTGFKLQGDIGKFGKTEISDIEGYAELPDGKVLSGSEWGNMLLWDGGLIQTEICRKKNKSCHTGTIQQITLNDGDIYTIGDDGSIRVWDFETIDTAEPSEEGVKLEIEPLNELKVGNNVALRSMVKDFSEESTFWYAQDSNGAIWKLDLGFSAQSENPKQLFNYHSGCINGIETCPISHLFATTADDGSVKVYDYLNFEILSQKKFTKSGTSLKWLNTGIDPEGGSLAAGFKDGVLRFLKLVPKNDKFELVLFEVFKPHTKAITRIAVDSKNSLIATGSDDQTVFFFGNKQNTRTPIGFVTLPAKVTFMTWTPGEYGKNRLLVCMENGGVYEFDAPVGESYDVTKTYLIELKLKCRKYQFKSIKSFLRHEEEMEVKRKEEEERKKKELEERRLRGLDEEDEKKKKKSEEKKDEDKKTDEENEQNEEDKKPKEDEWKPFIPERASKICWAMYSSEDTFWLSMDDYDAGYLYECKFLDDVQKSKMSPDKIDEPIRGVAVVKSDLTHNEDIPLTCITFDKSKKFAVIGEKNGVIRINPMDESKKIEDIKHYWSYGYHDNDYGHVTHITLSHDEKFLFSVGADSNIFGILFNSSVQDLEKARTEKIKVTSKAPVKEVSDIDDPQAYSIEQAKQKSEHDKMIAIAEAKKADMRQKINGLRKMFKDLTLKNDQLVPRLKLNRNEFSLEESIKQHVLNQINEKIDMTYKELAWQSEKCRLMLDKVKSKFKDVVDFDFIVVHTFDGSHNVSSFRTVTLPKDMEAYKKELEKQYLTKLLEKQKTKENLDSASLLDAKSDDSEITMLQGLSAAEQMKKIFGKLRGNTAAKVERALKKMDERRMKRLKRKREWSDLMQSKLPDDYENPDDLASIKYAEETIGDFKLKSSDDYVVSENERMNVYKAVERLMMIKDFIHKNQMLFNSKVLTLRDKKKGLVEEINRLIDRFEQIQFILGQEEQIPIQRPSMRPEEIPEKKYEYTRDRLLDFKKDLESKQNKSHDDESGGGLGAFGSNNSSTQPQAKKSDQKTQDQKNHKLDGLKPLWQNAELMTNLQKQTAQKKEIRLAYEQKQIIKLIEEKIHLFDAELKVLRHDKARVSVYMKNADLRHVTIFEEFLLLRDFEKTENELENKLSSKKDEHVDMQSKLAEIQSKLDSKKKDIDKIDDNLKQLLQTFTQMTHDETKYGDFLNKVYKRKIKRKKKAEGVEDEEESDEESEDEDDDDEDEDLDDDDSEAEGREQLDLDICPSGLRQDLFDQVCQLREKRLDFEEQIAEEKKILEQFKKDQDGLIKKAKIVENGLKQAQQELENFQKEKQKKINSLDIVVTLRLAQVQFLNKGRLPADLSEALAFDAKNLERLQLRIKELEVEKAAEKKLFKNLRERHHELIRDKKKMDEYVGKLDELCNKMMTDKYGKIVDLEKIELIAVNQQIEELKQKMSENESEHERVMKEWLEKINNEKDESIELLKANTTRINEMIELMSESKKLETTLDNKQRSLGQEMTSTSKKDLEERRRLHTLVQLQAQEVEALKAEIAILSRKGGHILPPSQPPTLAQS